MSPSANGAARDRLRIAIQKSGRLSEPARALLASSGLSWRESRDKLFCYGESLPVDLLLVRDDDIPGLIADGVCDLGVVGRNVLLEQAGERADTGKPAVFREWRALGFGGCRLSGSGASGRQSDSAQAWACGAVVGWCGNRQAQAARGCRDQGCLHQAAA